MFEIYFREIMKISKCINYLEVWSALKIRKLKQKYSKTIVSYENAHFYPKNKHKL